jgi:hypothetical protein
MPVEEYAALFQQNKALVDALVGSENNLGCSGAGSVNDYVQAGSLAGFKYLDGIVSMHYLSMPLENRPSAQWTNRYIMSGHHHENAPLELTERIYPFMAADAQDFQADANGAMLISAGDLGSLIRYAESSVGDDCQDRCVLTHEDVDFLVATLREIDGFRDRNRFAKVSIYLEVTLFNSKNEDGMRYFFAQMQQLSDEGIIEWATQMDVYRAFVGTANT